ncbi:MAG: M20/M25/M40 family metallo-hydrolase [Desulfobacteraceae bacterium]|nr:MAG: M20/M25/M40 family metallo-hydrolase [Desulfobacteraceae bacterium]
MINRERLAQTFQTLVQVDSISRQEGRLCRLIRQHLEGLGCNTRVDDAGSKTGGDSGNLIAYFPGKRCSEPLLLSAHMDTVEPGRGVRIRFEQGVFSSAGDTILGADDKSALAVILEVVQSIREQDLPCGPLEIVFTVCEEVGLLGAKHLAYELISARMGYVLDTRNPEAIVIRTPSANRLAFHVHGKAAHAGAAPERGINAISLAGKAIAQISLGRIDRETTCNIGLIEGGVAINIVPERVVVRGEVRSHDESKLQRVTAAMVSAFEGVVNAWHAEGIDDRPHLEVEVVRDFDRLNIDPDHAVVDMARRAAAGLGMRMDTAGSGGGSDANVFATRGIVTGVLGTGMENVHTVKETIRLDDMVRSARLLLGIIHLHANGTAIPLQ